MMTIKNYQPVNLDGPYVRRIRWIEYAASAIGHILIASILAYAVLGMAGAWDEAKACVECQERMGK